MCGEDAKSRCGGCKRVTYCGQSCQRKDWDAGHRTECARGSTHVPVAQEVVEDDEERNLVPIDDNFVVPADGEAVGGGFSPPPPFFD